MIYIPQDKNRLFPKILYSDRIIQTNKPLAILQSIKARILIYIYFSLLFSFNY